MMSPLTSSRAIPEAGRKRRFVLRGVLMVWAVLVLTSGAVLMADHWVTLPLPERDDPVLGAAMARERDDHGRSWVALHVLYARCTCSKRIFDHLMSRDPLPGVRERVVLVDTDPHFEQAIVARGFELEHVTHTELVERYNITGAPLLVVADPDATVRYLGGYTDRKQGPDIRDTRIITALQQDQAVDRLPLFGCAVSQSLQALLDPLGLKY